MVLVVVVPFLDEGRHLPEVIAALGAQERPADQVVLVDDGSVDASLEIARAAAVSDPRILALRRPARPRGADRLATAGELVAFQWALGHILADWDVVAKLDADIRLPPHALAELEQRLREDPRLGIAGTYLTEQRPDGEAARIPIGPGHVHGATKFYRRACWEQIAPLPAILGWDTIDELRARRVGWRTASFALTGGDPLHLRPRASQDGMLRGYRRFGVCAYAFGEPPLLMGLQALRQMRERPRVLAGLHYGIGYVGAALRRAPRAEPQLRAYARTEQRRRLRRRLAGTPR